MCVTPAGKIGNCTCGMPKLLPHSRKKGSLLHLLLPEQNRSSQFLFPPICRQEGIWSFEIPEFGIVLLLVVLVLGAWYSVESKVDHAYRVIVPCIKGTHWPEIATRSPQSSHQSSPVRAEICRAKSVFLPSFFAQYVIRVVWAEPVTGSSLMLCLGTKKAVSERLSSVAISCIVVTEIQRFSGQTAAGLPPKRRLVKASTW